MHRVIEPNDAIVFDPTSGDLNPGAMILEPFLIFVRLHHGGDEQGGALDARIQFGGTLSHKGRAGFSCGAQTKGAGGNGIVGGLNFEILQNNFF